MSSEPTLRLQAQQLDNFRLAWEVLQNRVRVALRTQVGDVQRLEVVRSQALSLLHTAESVSLSNYYLFIK